MPGRLDARGLEALVRKGEIDTVLTVVPDHYGRLMGKRMVGRHFVDHVLADGVHACIYLLTVDMEMEPQTGFKLTSWERGYGDMKMVPDLGTLRVIPWLPKTALVFCDVYDDDGEAIEEAPRWVLKRQVARAAAQGHLVKTAAELELYCFRETFEQARAKRYQNLTPVSDYLEDYHILQTTKEEPLIRAIRNGMEAADVPVETSKGEWGRGADGHGARARVLLCAGRQLVQALSSRLVRAHADCGGLGQPHVRVPPLRRGRGVPRGKPHSRRRRESLSRVRGHDRGRPARHR